MEILARFNGRNGEITVAQERWPAAGAEDAGPRLNALKGYNALAWTAGGINYWAVSDLNAAELGALQKLLSAS